MRSFLRKVAEAGSGIWYAARERHFQIHLMVAFIVLMLGVLLSISRIEWIMLLLLVGWVLTLEMINTIIEHVIDIFKPEFHEYAKLFKEVASGAVLLSAGIAGVIGFLIFAPRLAVFIRLLG